MESHKKLSPITTELFLGGRKINISLIFISKSYSKVPKTINATHYFIIKTPNKRELQQITSNYSLDIGFKSFMKTYKDYTKRNILIFSE